MLPVGLEEDKLTDPPAQKVVAPFAEIVGVVGELFVTVVGIEVALHAPFETVTV